MLKEIETQLLTFKGWTFRLHRAQAKPERLLLLIHGWMGDENSMWVFARRLSPKYMILSPRAPFPVPEGSFSWREIKPVTWGKATLEELEPAAESLLDFLSYWLHMESIDVTQFDLMGFSQGAALVYTLALLQPERIRKLAALSGFIPEGGELLVTSLKFSDKLIFITHGRQDELIPVAAARKAVETFKRAGAQVTYCESDSGHKVSKECLKEMEKFMGRH